jgi:tetratricopeptide (TPR) repeat protein
MMPVRGCFARAFLAKGDAAGAMPDLDSILAVRSGDVQALTVRGIAWSSMREYSKALDDLNQAIEKQETIENHVARGAVHEAQNNINKAAADFRRAAQLAPKTVFEAAAQNNAKKKAEQLSKRVPCGSGGQGKSSDTCL